MEDKAQTWWWVVAETWRWVVVALLGVHLVVSVVLFYWPSLLHPHHTHPLLRRCLSKVALVAHRGGSLLAVENTLQAFDAGVAAGSDVLEMDVCTTKDGQVVVCHDPVLDRLTGQEVKVEDTDYDCLPRHQQHIPIHFVYPWETMASPTDSTGHAFPLLSTVLERYSRTRVHFNIEVKQPSERVVKQIYQMVSRLGLEERVTWGVKYGQYSPLLAQVDPHRRLPVFFSEQSCLRLYISYLFGLVQYLSFQENSLQFPYPTHAFYQMKLRETKGRAVWLRVNLFFLVLNLFFLVSGPLIGHLNRRGIMVVYWVVNDEASFGKCVSKGANGIMTDHPPSLRAYLAQEHLLLSP